MVLLNNISIFWSMFHVFFLFVILFRSRYTHKKTIVVTCIGIGALMVLNGGLLIVYGFEVLGKAFLFTCSIPSFILFFVMSADRKFRFLLTFCLVDTICLWLMAVTNLLNYFFGGEKGVLLLVSRLIAFPLIEYLMWKYLRKPYIELQDAVEKGWGIFAGMTMLYYLLLVVVVQFPTNIVERPEDMFVCILVLVLMLFNYGTIFLSLYNQLMLYRRQQAERVLQEQKNTLEAQLSNQQRIRKMKHDMKGHVAALSGLLATGKTKEAQEYLKNVEIEVDTLFGPFCPNPYLNAVFTYYFQKLQELEAECRMDIQIGEEELPYMDLCQIISNGLGNACDAIKGLREEDREVSVQMKYSKDYLIVRIKNRCRSDLQVEKGTIPATEKKGHDHGFGLVTVQEAAKRLGGEMFCYTENGNFVLDVMVLCRSLQRGMK
ncbi:MAG: GHKL domain-containing protein [Lachnospiraceae bacterium]|jgi:hypothetical protein|nr:GHKL domain-containing protein [Lachnospiraceae bacterium]